MEIVLVVVRAFGPYRRGDVLTDAVLIARVLSSELAQSVVRTKRKTVKE